MQGSDFVFVVGGSRFGVVAKIRWNENRALLPNTQEAADEAWEFLQTLSPDFVQRADFLFSCKSGVKKARALLIEAGAVETQFGQFVQEG